MQCLEGMEEQPLSGGAGDRLPADRRKGKQRVIGKQVKQKRGKSESSSL